MTRPVLPQDFGRKDSACFRRHPTAEMRRVSDGVLGMVASSGPKVLETLVQRKNKGLTEREKSNFGDDRRELRD